MLQIYAHSFERAVFHLGVVRGLISGYASASKLSLKQPFLDKDIDVAGEALSELTLEVKKLDAGMALITLNRLAGLVRTDDCTMEDFVVLLDESERRLYDELSLRYVFSLDGKDAALFDTGSFGPDVAAKFPAQLIRQHKV